MSYTKSNGRLLRICWSSGVFLRILSLDIVVLTVPDGHIILQNEMWALHRISVTPSGIPYAIGDPHVFPARSMLV